MPALPYFCGAHLLWLALLLGAVGLSAAGAASSRFTGKPFWYAGGRQLLLGAAAAAITFGIGHAVGAGVS